MRVDLIIPIAVCLFAALSGGFLSQYWQQRRKRYQHRKMIRERYFGQSQDIFRAQKAQKKLPEMILAFAGTQSNLMWLKPQNSYLAQGFWSMGSAGLKELSRYAGLETKVSLSGFCHTRALLCIGGSMCCALLGAVFSSELMLMGFAVGAVLGWRMPAWALKQQAKERKQDLEDHLSEMLEVVSLGLRSGLSFDQSFELYHGHFRTKLGVEAASIQHQWQLGLTTREEALRAFAQTYDSPLFSRVIENIIRSLRFGVSLADSFDSAALEARLIHKAHREEEVAKAPVKMLVPTAALILPAMLLLVLGPVLLDMMQGF